MAGMLVTDICMSTCQAIKDTSAVNSIEGIHIGKYLQRETVVLALGILLNQLKNSH